MLKNSLILKVVVKLTIASFIRKIFVELCSKRVIYRKLKFLIRFAKDTITHAIYHFKIFPYLFKSLQSYKYFNF